MPYCVTYEGMYTRSWWNSTRIAGSLWRGMGRGSSTLWQWLGRQCWFRYGTTLRDQGVVPVILMELRANMEGGAGDSHSLVALAIFRLQKYETWREYLGGWTTTAGALTRAIENMVGRYKGTLPSLLAEISRSRPGIEPKHLWPLLGGFETYASALLHFSVMCHVQVHRAEYHSPDDWDALQEASKEYDEVERQVRLEAEDKNECGERFEELDISEDDERLYEVLNLENARKIRKRPEAPKWTIRLSKALWDYPKEPAKADERSLVKDIWRIIMKMDRGGETYLKEEWKKKQKRENKMRRKERKKAKKTARNGKKIRRRRLRDSKSSSSRSSSCSSDTSESSSSSQSSGRGSR